MSPPSSIAHYRITAKLGEGGMGAVYRATDTKLNRGVAIKVLPAAFAEDAGRMARFEREAQVLASLNHPNIAAIYGIEAGAIVMELVEGEDLKGPLPVETAIAYAKQIAAGLEAAHEKGIVHRDLKPANIKVTHDGTVKLLDFGLARPTESSAVAAGPTMSPTISLSLTQAGMILGTAAYMSPEQARGRPVDKRADIWAFGVVLFELLAGRRIFGGETATDAIAAVMKSEPDWSALPADTPPRVRRLLECCLRKDPNLRLRDIGAALFLLDEPEPVPAASGRQRTWPYLAVAGLALAAAATMAGVAWRQPKSVDPVTVRFPFALPEGTSEPSFSLAASQPVPSPDGRYLAFIAISSGHSSLWVRPMSSLSAHRLDNTDGANYPFWSPDGQFLAFFADNKLKKIPAGGGSPQAICEARSLGQGPNASAGDGGTWNAGGIIVFAPNPDSSLMRVLAAGGPATAATTLDTAAGERNHSWPQFLPDGRHMLYFARNLDPAKSGIYFQELGSSQRVLVTRNLLHGAWSPPGYLLFPRAGSLLAQHMDPRTGQLTGEPTAVAEQVSSNASSGRSAFAVSGNGVLTYRGGSLAPIGQLTWYDREGKRLGPIGKPGEYWTVKLSPDDKSAAISTGPAGQQDVWIMDLAGGVLTRMTTDSQASTPGPWSPDSRRLATNSRGKKTILELTVASGKTRDLGTSGLVVEDWLPDGRMLLCTGGGSTSGPTSLATVSLESGPQPRNIDVTAYRRSDFHLAPDGKSVVYSSFESGRSQVTVASFPSFSEKRQVSTDGGHSPALRKDGREVFFVTPDGTLMSAEIGFGAKIEVSVPKPLFKFPAGSYLDRYSPAGDGKRFLVIESVRPAAAQVTVVVNWAAELKQP